MAWSGASESPAENLTMTKPPIQLGVSIKLSRLIPKYHPGGGSQICSSSCLAAAKSLQSCLTLSDPVDCSLPGSSVHGIFQARVLEWGAIAFALLVCNVK